MPKEDELVDKANRKRRAAFERDGAACHLNTFCGGIKIMRLSALFLVFGWVTIVCSDAKALDIPEQLAGAALEANPEISMLRHQVAALKEQEGASVIWRDPVFMVEYSNAPWEDPSLGEHPMSGLQLKVQQTFPFPGKNDRRQAVAAGHVDLKALELAELKSQLRGKVRQLYWRLVLVKRLTGIRDKHISTLERLLEAVQAKYASGVANQQDILKLQVLKEKLTDEIEDLNQKKRELRAMINSALHRDISTPLETGEEIPLMECTTTLHELIERAKKERQLLKFWKKKAEVERLAADKELYEGRPDITLWTGYRIRKEVGADKGEDFFSVGMSLPIPVDYKDRYNAKRRARLADALASEEKYRSMLDKVSSEIEKSLSKWERSCNKVTTYNRQLIPGAKSTLEAALSAWEVGRTEFSSLYQAEVQLLDFEKAVLMARAETVLMSLEIERLVGTPAERATEEAL
ncbi:MAG: TolC family protein [Thermodesulfobacteriota bacterium]|nr:TolC family protein [Thermodesulfobacteriota bacterium]